MAGNGKAAAEDDSPRAASMQSLRTVIVPRLRTGCHRHGFTLFQADKSEKNGNKAKGQGNSPPKSCATQRVLGTKTVEHNEQNEAIPEGVDSHRGIDAACALPYPT